MTMTPADLAAIETWNNTHVMGAAYQNCRSLIEEVRRGWGDNLVAPPENWPGLANESRCKLLQACVAAGVAVQGVWLSEAACAAIEKLLAANSRLRGAWKELRDLIKNDGSVSACLALSCVAAALKESEARP
jgi:hypothetical protein